MPSINSLMSVVTSFSADFIILAIVFGALFVYGFYFGKDRIIAFIFSLYAAFVLYSYFPYVRQLSLFNRSNEQLVLSQLLIFAVLFFFALSVMKHLVIADFPYARTRKLLELSILSVSAIVLLAVLVYHIVPVERLHNFSGVFDTLFAQTRYVFWWLAAPLVAIFFVTRR
jgi:hypothetical protein